MAQSNYAALTEGLKTYTDTMRAFLKKKLMARFPNDWWKRGVLPALTDAQRSQLERDALKHRDKAEALDPAHFVRLVTRNFDDPLNGVFADFKKTQSLLTQIAVARTEWAHPKTGDWLADDVSHALYAIVQVLEDVDEAAARQVASTRQSISGTPTPGPKPVTPTAVPAKQGELPYWWQTCEPRDGFKNPASIDEALFAATLGGVYNKAAPDEFLKPAVFLGHTYFTDNLKLTVRDVISRIGGGEGPAVTEMETPFGGGKTHALLTLYHIINAPKEALAVPGVKEALGGLSVPSKARVLVFDGQEHGVEPWLKQDGASVSTLWGELAHQINPANAWKLVTDSDGRGVAPGNAVYRKVLEQAPPCLILVDELVSYLVKLKFSNERRTQNLYRQTVQFLQETLQLASTVKGVCVLISLPKSVREFGGLNPLELNQQLGVLEDLQPKADRVVSKRTPVNDDEIYLLMRKRLFQKVDENAARRVAEAYQKLYRRPDSKAPDPFADEVRTEAYVRQQADAYPLHPELIDTLYKKWSTASDFPRTRAALQLMASIVADQWVNRRQAYTIQTAHVNLERERIRTRIVSAAGAGGGYDAVVATDIIGGDAHADLFDQKLGNDYARHHIARGVATTLLMHSFGGRAVSGALLWELRLGTVGPNVGPQHVDEVLRSLTESLWYVHREGEMLRFLTKMNVYRAIAENARKQRDASVLDRLHEEMAKAQGEDKGFLVLTWTVGTGGPPPDRPDPTIAILGPSHGVREGEGGKPEGRTKIDQMWDKPGAAGKREWRNALLLIAPDAELWQRAEEAMREVMAYEQIIGEAEARKIELSQLELKELSDKLKGKRESVRTSIVSAYRWIFVPQQAGLDVVALPVPATQDERVASRVVRRLKDNAYGPPKVLDQVGHVYFNAKIAPSLWKDDERALPLDEANRRLGKWTYLPILPNREGVLRTCIRDGIRAEAWAVALGDAAAWKFSELIDTQDGLDRLTNLFDGSAHLVRGEALAELQKLLGRVEQTDGKPERPGKKGDGPGETDGGSKDVHIPLPKRYGAVTVVLSGLKIAKTGNLQPYLFKVLQEQDPGAEIEIAIDVKSSAGISEEALNKRVVEGLEQLGIEVRWRGG